MLFRSNGKFIDDVTDSFGRFGIQTIAAEKGSRKHIQRFKMYDSIHDSGYAAIAADAPLGKDADKEWEKIIENDLMPLLEGKDGKPDEAASALIVPSKDIDKVEAMLKDKGLNPTVYQLFPGYAVAGLNKKDTSKIADEYFGKKQAEEEKPDEEPEKDTPVKETIKDKNDTENKKPEKTEDEPAIREERIREREDRDNTVKDDRAKPAEQKKLPDKTAAELDKKSPKPAMSLPKKLAVAALLGTGLGLGAASAPTAINAFQEYTTPPEIKAERLAYNDAAKNYFDGLKDGFQENEELLKALASNPKLAKQYIEEIADTPVQTELLKNPSQSDKNIKEAANSKDEKIRAAAAENPSADKETLKKLSKDKSITVLKSLCKNPSISPEMMDELANYSALHTSLLENKNLTPEILTRIAASKQRSCDFNKKYMANPCVSIEELIYNKKNPDECVREGIAANPNTPAETVRELAGDANPMIRQAALKNKNLPKEELDKLFPPHWIPEQNNSRLESDRTAALENPNISSDIREKAVFLNPKQYAAAVAKNPSASESLVNKMQNMAQGKNGVKRFINTSNNIKNDNDKMERLSKAAKENNGNIEKDLRRIMNKDFVKDVYDPYALIEDMRKIPSKNNKNNLKANKEEKGKEQLWNIREIAPSILDENGNAPDLFAQMPLPAMSPNNVSYNPDAERASLKTADDIVGDMMSDILPDLEKTLKSGGFNPDGAEGSKGNSGNTGNQPQASSASRNGAGNGGALSLLPTRNSSESDEISPVQQVIFQNSCKRIDDLYNMF